MITLRGVSLSSDLTWTFEGFQSKTCLVRDPIPCRLPPPPQERYFAKLLECQFLKLSKFGSCGRTRLDLLLAVFEFYSLRIRRSIRSFRRRVLEAACTCLPHYTKLLLSLQKHLDTCRNCPQLRAPQTRSGLETLNLTKPLRWEVRLAKPKVVRPKVVPVEFGVREHLPPHL